MKKLSKLSINKKTIGKLQKNEMENIHGKGHYSIVVIAKLKKQARFPSTDRPDAR